MSTTVSVANPPNKSEISSLDRLLSVLQIPPNLPRYDAIASASENTATSGPINADTINNIQDLGGINGILDKLKETGIDESDPRHSEIVSQLESLNLDSHEYSGSQNEESVEANKILLVKLDMWLNRVEERLMSLLEVVRSLDMKEETTKTTEQDEEDPEDTADKKTKTLVDVQAQVIFTVAAFIPDEVGTYHRWQRWISPGTSSIAHEILDTLFQNKLPLPLLEVLLTHHIKTIFQYNVHPNINPTTGRKLPRPAGGPLASQDFYESQRWKEHPGMGNVLLWCLKHFDTEYYEKIWHLLVPPIMTMLDDYEAKYKLVGIGIVREMLKTVPGFLLKRTGVDGLIRSALNTAFAHLQSEESPALVREAIYAQVDLTLLTTRPSEKAYFDQLADVLMGQGIIGSVWFYGYDKEKVILASIEALHRVVVALGIGTVRFLKALITQLIDPLLPKPLRYVPVQLQVTSIEALWCVMQECSPRIDGKYAGMIADAVSRCWVNLSLQENSIGSLNSKDIGTLKTMLKQTCERLKEISPIVVEEYKLMSGVAVQLDDLFQGLV